MIVRELIALLGVQVDKQSFAGAEATLAGFAKAAVAAFAGFKVGQWITGAVQQTARLADELEEMSLRTGVAVDSLQRFAYVGSLVGVGLGEMEMGTKFLSIALEETRKKGSEAGAIFQRMGVNVRRADGRLKSIEELLPEVSDGMNRLKSDTERVAAAQKLFGRSGTRMLPILKQGSDAIREQFAEAEALGGLLDEELVKVGGEVADNQDRLAFAYRGVKNAIAKGMLPWYQKIQQATLNWIRANGAWLRQGIVRVFDRVGQVLSNIASAFGRVGAAVVAWFQRMSPLQKSLIKMSAIFAGLALLLMLPGGSILLLIGLIALLIDDFEVWRKGGKSVIGDLVKSLNEFFGFDIEKAFGLWWKATKDFFVSATSTLGAFGKFFVDIFTVGISQAWKNLTKLLGAIWGDSANMFAQLWNEVILDFAHGIALNIGKAWDAVTSGAESVVTSIENGFSYVGESIKIFVFAIGDLFVGLWNGIKAGAQAVWDFLTAGWKLWESFVFAVGQAINNGFAWLWNGIKAGAQAVWDFLTAGWNAWSTFITAIRQAMFDGFAWLWEGLKAGAQAVWDFLVAGFTGWQEWIRGIFDAVFGIFKRLWDGVVGGFKTAWDNAIADGKGFLGALGDAILGALTGWFDAVVGWASDVIAAIAKPFKAVGKWIGGLFSSEAEQAGAEAEAEVARLRELQKRRGVEPGAPAVGPGAGARWSEGFKEAMSIAARPGATLAAPAVLPAARAGGAFINQPSSKVDVRVQAAPGMSEEVLAGEVARQVAAVYERENRAAIRALVPAAAGD